MKTQVYNVRKRLSRSASFDLVYEQNRPLFAVSFDNVTVVPAGTCSALRDIDPGSQFHI